MPPTAAPPDPTELTRIQAELEGAEPLAILGWAYERFGSVAIVASFQAESCALIDMATRLAPAERVRVITLDTGWLPPETHALIARMRERYHVPIAVWRPDPAAVDRMEADHGRALFRRSVALRRLCCEVRKQAPLARALQGTEAWITGLRRDQAPSRCDTPVVEADLANGGIAKIAPLVRWTAAQVDAYLERCDVPRHPLYAHGYTSIGCAPCTRATRPGEDPRAGRWWWEVGEPKECGLHPSHPARRPAAAETAA